MHRSAAFAVLALAALLFTMAAALPGAGAEEPPAGEAFVLGGEAERGKADYETFCASCHGAEGKGDGEMGMYLTTPPRDMTDAEYMKTRSDEQLYLAVKLGGLEVGLSDKMAPWEHLLSDRQIRDLAAFVRTFSEKPEAP